MAKDHTKVGDPDAKIIEFKKASELDRSTLTVRACSSSLTRCGQAAINQLGLSNCETVLVDDQPRLTSNRVDLSGQVKTRERDFDTVDLDKLLTGTCKRIGEILGCIVIGVIADLDRNRLECHDVGYRADQAVCRDFPLSGKADFGVATRHSGQNIHAHVKLDQKAVDNDACSAGVGLTRPRCTLRSAAKYQRGTVSTQCDRQHQTLVFERQLIKTNGRRFNRHRTDIERWSGGLAFRNVRNCEDRRVDRRQGIDIGRVGLVSDGKAMICTK